MDKIDPDKCEHYVAYLDSRCIITGMLCNPGHPECEYEDERKLGIPEDLMEEK